MAWSDAARAAALATRRAHAHGPTPKGKRMVSLGGGYHATRDRLAHSMAKVRRHGMRTGYHGYRLHEYTRRHGVGKLMKAIDRSGR
jgi:hypothetical protein